MTHATQLAITPDELQRAIARGLAGYRPPDPPPELSKGALAMRRHRIKRATGNVRRYRVRKAATPTSLPPVSLDKTKAPNFDPKHHGVAVNEHPIGASVGIDWLICGGESGPKVRPCHIEWINSIVAQCKAAAVRVFVKQMGANTLCHNANAFDWPDSTRLVETCCVEGVAACGVYWRDKKGGDPSEWPADLRVREFPKEGNRISED